MFIAFQRMNYSAVAPVVFLPATQAQLGIRKFNESWCKMT